MSGGQRRQPVGEIAEQVAARLDTIRDALRRSAWAEARRHPIPLTPQQLAVVQLLVDDLRAGNTGPSLSELTKRMGLAHSTVSGIVDRLEHRGLVRRTSAPPDRRITNVELTQPVQQWVKDDLVATRLRPLVAALNHATKAERQQILTALETLERLIEHTTAR